jgi:hypothetical protein
MLCALLLVPTLAFLRHGEAPKPTVDIGALLKGAAALGVPAGGAAKPAETKPQQQTTIDVGLDSFLQNLTHELVANTTGNVGANASVPSFDAAVASAVEQDVKAALLPVKKEIAAHWMDLKPEKRDEYVVMLKAKFAELLHGATDPFLRHATIKFHTAKDLASDHVAKDLEYVMKTPTSRLVSSLKDYTDLLYMSNIFLSFHEKHHTQQASVFLEIK